jgi:hypothetical protein
MPRFSTAAMAPCKRVGLHYKRFPLTRFNEIKSLDAENSAFFPKPPASWGSRGKTSFNVAMTVIEELCAENAALRAETEKLAAENKRLQDQLAQLQAKLGRAAKTSKNSSLPPSQSLKINRLSAGVQVANLL